MWPYTGEESRWLGKSEPRAANLADIRTSNISVHPSTQLTTTPATVSQTRAGAPHWLQALERLFRPADHVADQNALPLLVARFKDPLNAIRDSAEALRGNPGLSRDQQARHLSVVLQEHEHLTAMISAMLDTVAVQGKASDQA